MSFKSKLRALTPRTVRAHRILRGPLRGRMIVTSLHDYPSAILGRTEISLLAWFRRNVKPGETWLDVGAHYGYTAIALAELVGRGGRVLAFEPSLTTAGHLTRTRALNGLEQLTIVPFALGEPGEIRTLSVSIDRGMANHTLGGARSETIYVVGFDDLWPALGQGVVNGVKVDVQGMELQVLTGMSRMLSKHRPELVVEFHPGVNRRSVLELLSGLGYVLPAMPVEPLPGETEVTYRDDRSYAFSPRIDLP